MSSSSPHASRVIPPEGSFSHVLFRSDWNPEPAWDCSGYSEIAHSRCIQWPENLPFPALIRGSSNRYFPRPIDRSTCCVFVRSSHLRTRLLKLGWVEITNLWNSAREKQPAPKVPLVVPSGPLGEVVAPPIPSGAFKGHRILPPSPALSKVIKDGTLRDLEEALVPGFPPEDIRSCILMEKTGQNRRGALKLLEQYLLAPPAQERAAALG